MAAGVEDPSAIAADETVRMAGGTATPTIPPTRIEGIETTRRRRRLLAPVVTLGMVGAVAGGLYFLWGSRVEARPPDSQGTAAIEDSLTAAGPDDLDQEGVRPVPVPAGTGDSGQSRPPSTPSVSAPELGNALSPQQLSLELAALQDSIRFRSGGPSLHFASGR